MACKIYAQQTWPIFCQMNYVVCLLVFLNLLLSDSQSNQGGFKRWGAGTNRNQEARTNQKPEKTRLKPRPLAPEASDP